MNDLNQLLELSACWQQLIKEKQKRYIQIPSPENRILPAIKLASLKLDLRYMEEELCSKIQIELSDVLQPR